MQLQSIEPTTVSVERVSSLKPKTKQQQKNITNDANDDDFSFRLLPINFNIFRNEEEKWRHFASTYTRDLDILKPF